MAIKYRIMIPGGIYLRRSKVCKGLMRTHMDGTEHTAHVFHTELIAKRFARNYPGSTVVPFNGT